MQLDPGVIPDNIGLNLDGSFAQLLHSPGMEKTKSIYLFSTAASIRIRSVVSKRRKEQHKLYSITTALR